MKITATDISSLTTSTHAFPVTGISGSHRPTHFEKPTALQEAKQALRTV